MVTKIPGMKMIQLPNGSIQIEAERGVWKWFLLTAAMGLKDHETKELRVFANFLTALTDFERDHLATGRAS